MLIYIDADALPGALKELLCQNAVRRKVETIFVANKSLSVFSSPFLKQERVAPDPDSADHYIASHAVRGDLAVTADIPLAKALVDKDVVVIDHRGKSFNADNINEILASRDLMQELRDLGEVTTGTRPFGPRDKRLFADALDRELTKLLRGR